VTFISDRTWHHGIPRETRAFAAAGWLAVCLSVFGFGVWGASAPIAGAVVAPGVFVTTGQNKTVQHLEGGVIRSILVEEGDLVEQGQPLILLDETAARADLRRLQLREARMLAIQTRLLAEMGQEQDISFPPELIDFASRDPEIAGVVASQRQVFEARRRSVQGDINALQESIKGLDEHIQGAQMQLASTRSQLGMFKEELDGKTRLLASGLIRKSEVLSLQRAKASAEGEVGRLVGDIGDSRERIARTQEQIRGVSNAAVKAAADQLHEVGGDLNDTRERIRSAQAVLDRVTITAPVKGTVVKLRYRTPGGVVEPGKSILEIVPREDMVIEARVRPQDIEHVRLGQDASVRLSAMNQRTTPMIKGEVVYVSADALPDEKRGFAGTDGYVVRVRLSREESGLAAFVPTSGMPAELYIRTGDRTFFQYLMKPVFDSFSRAFRET
jgi:HlyD family secretion protein